MRFARAVLAATFALLVSALAAAAQESAQPPSSPDAAAEAKMAAADDAEKQAREACKVEICDILTGKHPQGPDVSCDIVKTWHEQDITRMLGGKFDWPWGDAVCQSKLNIGREPLVKAMTEPSYEVELPEQKVQCRLAQKSEREPYAVDVSIAPKVAFEHGKAVSARINWGEANAPMLAYALIYAGTGFDNSANVLGAEVVRMVNEFTGKKCARTVPDQPNPPGN